MKLNSISGVTCLVKNLDQTAEFYEALGFRIGAREPNRLTCYVNWFWVTFVVPGPDEPAARRKEARAANKGVGQFLHLKVDDIDECYREVVARGCQPSGEPTKTATGAREFVLLDPDGYKLVFFAKK